MYIIRIGPQAWSYGDDQESCHPMAEWHARRHIIGNRRRQDRHAPRTGSKGSPSKRSSAQKRIDAVYYASPVINALDLNLSTGMLGVEIEASQDGSLGGLSGEAAIVDTASGRSDALSDVLVGVDAEVEEGNDWECGGESDDEEREGRKGRLRSCARFLVSHRTWLLGLVVFALGNGGDFIALGITKQSVVTLVGSWTLTVNTMMAKCLLGETTIKLDVVSAFVIIGGISLTVVGSESAPREWPIASISHQFRTAKVIVLFCSFTAAIILMAAVVAFDRVARVRAAAAAGVATRSPRQRIGALYVLLGAAVATFTVVFGKAFSGMLALSTAPDEPPQFTTEAGRPNPWAAMVVILFLISVPTQLILINLSLAVNDALYHIPSFYVAWNLGSITAGAVVYEELSDMNLRQALMFGAGIVVLVLGIVLTNVSMAMKASAQFRMKTNLICALAMGAFHLCTVILSSYALKDESMAIHQNLTLNEEHLSDSTLTKVIRCAGKDRLGTRVAQRF